VTRNDYQEDKNLAWRMKNGDEVALQVFFERYADALFAFIAIHLDGEPRDVHRNDAEDIWQEALIAATQSIGSYRGRSRLFTWLCAIARRKTADHFRQQKNLEISLTEGMLGEIRVHMRERQLPEELLMHRATRLRVIATLGCLPEDYRRALVGRYVDGHSVKELAESLGRTYKATESLLSRARVKFQEVFLTADGGQDDKR
jgi:RNA polymerase sigma-70 factor (ECF subfamily)